MSLENKISNEELIRILKKYYNIESIIEIKELTGEVDLNFKIITKQNDNKDKNYLIKISRGSYDEEEIEFQIDILKYLNRNSKSSLEKEFNLVLKSNNNEDYVKYEQTNISPYVEKITRIVRIYSWIEGKNLNKINPIAKELIYEVGKACGRVTESLKDYKNEYAKRKLDWDLAQYNWVEKYIHLFNNNNKEESLKKEAISYFINAFKSVADKNSYKDFRKSIVQNDANEGNIIINTEYNRNDNTKPISHFNYKVTIIDFGDAVFTQSINDLAVGLTYILMLKKNNYNDLFETLKQFISGYNSIFALRKNEISMIYFLIAIRLVISLTKSAINRFKEPENEYLFVSEKGGWELLLFLYHFPEEIFTSYCLYCCNFENNEFNHLDALNFSLSDLIKKRSSLNREKNEIKDKSDEDISIDLVDFSIGSMISGNYSNMNSLYKLSKQIREYYEELEMLKELDYYNKNSKFPDILVTNYSQCEPYIYFSNKTKISNEFNYFLGVRIFFNPYNKEAYYIKNPFDNCLFVGKNVYSYSFNEFFNENNDFSFDISNDINVNECILKESYNIVLELDISNKNDKIINKVSGSNRLLLVISSNKNIFNNEIYDKKDNDLVEVNETIGELVKNKDEDNSLTYISIQIIKKLKKQYINPINSSIASNKSNEIINIINRVSFKNLEFFINKYSIDPLLIFNRNAIISISENNKSNDSLINKRNKYLGKGLSVTTYSNYEAINIQRGMKQYLVSDKGEIFLDTVNNVAHVGHEHPYIVNQIKKQTSILNTNTRYLHSNITELAEQLLKTFPDELNTVFFVNSGSEANELAIRMAKTHTNSENMITVEHGYYGNTQSCINLSSYKFNGKGGKGCCDTTYLVNCPDTLKGKYNNFNINKYINENNSNMDNKENAFSHLYSQEVLEAIKIIKNKNKKICGFISESIVCCGGQIEFPINYLKLVYEEIRKEGGVCILDEVQTGFGRIGTHFWGFNKYQVIPDIVTLGKPFGNGHPLAAVVCNRKIAESFDNGMEYFSTFGGNPVSCLVGLSLLKIIEKERLQENALIVGNYFKQCLQELKKDFNDIISDIRGEGLFLGIEISKIIYNENRELICTPLSRKTKYLVKRMIDFKIFISVDGPDNNVLKIKPPMCFNKSNVEYIIKCMRVILQEDFFKIKEFNEEAFNQFNSIL